MVSDMLKLTLKKLTVRWFVIAEKLYLCHNGTII